MTDELRTSVPGDEPELKALWKAVFEDEDAVIDSFFELLYKPGTAWVFVCGGHIVSAAYVLKLGDFALEGNVRPCRVIYALGTHPEYRGRGFGSRVLKAACDSSNALGRTFIVPAGQALFDFYKKYGFTAYFNVREVTADDPGTNLSGSVTRATVRGYAALREELLRGTPHIDLDIPAIEFQKRLCAMYGGGLYYVVSDKSRCAAAVECHDGAAFIRELIVPSGSRDEAAMLVSRALRVTRYSYRAPVRPGEQAQPFAMVSAPAPEHDTGLAWFGPAFD